MEKLILHSETLNKNLFYERQLLVGGGGGALRKYCKQMALSSHESKEEEPFSPINTVKPLSIIPMCVVCYASIIHFLWCLHITIKITFPHPSFI
jgi:hypothetical protein